VRDIGHCVVPSVGSAAETINSENVPTHEDREPAEPQSDYCAIQLNSWSLCRHFLIGFAAWAVTSFLLLASATGYQLSFVGAQLSLQVVQHYWGRSAASNFIGGCLRWAGRALQWLRSGRCWRPLIGHVTWQVGLWEDPYDNKPASMVAGLSRISWPGEVFSM
jgi:hypothetical protein